MGKKKKILLYFAAIAIVISGSLAVWLRFDRGRMEGKPKEESAESKEAEPQKREMTVLVDEAGLYDYELREMGRLFAYQDSQGFEKVLFNVQAIGSFEKKGDEYILPVMVGNKQVELVAGQGEGAFLVEEIPEKFKSTHEILLKPVKELVEKGIEPGIIRIRLIVKVEGRSIDEFIQLPGCVEWCRAQFKVLKQTIDNNKLVYESLVNNRVDDDIQAGIRIGPIDQISFKKDKR